MVRKSGAFFTFAFFLASSAFAQTATYRLDPSQGEIKFSVRATVYTINGKAKEADGKVSFDPEAKEVKLPMTLEIPVESLKTRNKLRDRDMRKMFEDKSYPTLSFKATKVTCGSGEAPQFLKCDAEGILKIRDIEKPVQFPVELTLRETKVKAAGSVTIKRDDFGLKTPSMLGMIRVSEDVTIKFDTVWLKES